MTDAPLETTTGPEEIVYRQKARFTREEITEAMTQLPENSWMTPPEGFIGAYFVREIGSVMTQVIPALQFDQFYEAETAIAESVQNAQTSKAPKPAAS